MATAVQQSRLQTDLNRLAVAHSKPRCLHIRFSGRRCGSPAMRSRPYCFFHAKQREPQPSRLHLAGLEDASAIQFNLARVMNDLQCGRLTRKDAYLYLLALQIASSNVKQVEKELEREEPVTESESELLAAEGFADTPEARDAAAQEHGELTGDEKLRHEEGEAHDARIIKQVLDSSEQVTGEAENDYVMRLKRSTKWMHDQQSEHIEDDSGQTEAALNAKVFGEQDTEDLSDQEE
jgi:hypothetical protein